MRYRVWKELGCVKSPLASLSGAKGNKAPGFLIDLLEMFCSNGVAIFFLFNIFGSWQFLALADLVKIIIRITHLILV